MASASAGIARRAMRTRVRDVPTLVRALWWLALARTLMVARGFTVAARALGLRPLAVVEVEPGPVPLIPEHALRALRVSLRLMEVRMLRVSCLPRAIVLERTMEAHGYPADLVIGVRTEDGFEAHAWLEVDGHPVGWDEQGARGWRPVARFRSAGARALSREGAA